MDKNLRKCYECLDLPISSTIEDVQLREKALIKICENEAKEKGVDCNKRLADVEMSAKTIINNIKNNGIPKEENHYFDSSWKSVATLAVVLAFVAMICFFSFYIFY